MAEAISVPRPKADAAQDFWPDSGINPAKGILPKASQVD